MPGDSPTDRPTPASGAVTGLRFQQKENEGLNVAWSEENGETEVVCALSVSRAKTGVSILAAQVHAALCDSPPVPLTATGSSTEGSSVRATEWELQHLWPTKASLLYKLDETRWWFHPAKGRRTSP